MKVMDSFRIVWRNLWRMKLRTALTSVGVMIGTAAIVAMIALSLGLKENAVKSLENFGNLTEMDVEPMYYIPEEDRVIPDEERKKLNMEAVQELKQIPGIAAVMPVKRLQEQAKLKVGRREGYVELIGVDVNESAAYRKNDIDKGSYLSGSPQEIVIASDVPREMRDVEKEKREARRSNVDARGKGPSPMPPPDMGGGAPAPLNLVDKAATIMLSREYRVDDEPKYEKKELRVRIVGQLQKSENQRYSTAVYVPINVVKELNDWVNRSRGDETSEGGPVRRTREQAKQDRFEFDQMTVKVESREQVEGVVKALKEKGYEVWSPARELETINKFFFVIQIVLGGIAAISLLVATIGIVNTMIMSILERTKEIGIMKVIGATVFNIRWLFLMESGFIGLIGGLTGLGLAWGAVELVNYFGSAGGLMDSLNMGYGRGGEGEGGAAAKLAVIPGWLALFAIGFSFVIGLLAGIFPAIRASRLSALQAIRSE